MFLTIARPRALPRLLFRMLDREIEFTFEEEAATLRTEEKERERYTEGDLYSD